MAMNRALIGRQYPASTYKVSEDAMVRYALATNEINPRLVEPGAGNPLIAAPVFPVVYHAAVLGKPISDPELNIEFRRALHGEQDMTFHRPVRAGDIISTTPSIEDIRDKGTGETISIRLSSQDQAGDLVEETLFTLFVRGRPVEGEKQSAKSPKTAADAAALGDPVATIEQKLDEDQTFRYSEASGDKVRIHLDPEVARKAGFAGIIGHGLCTLAFTSRAVVDGVAGGSPERLRRLAVRFAAPVIPGETITTRIWPNSNVGESVGGEYTFETRDPRGKLVISDGRAIIE